MDKSNSSVKTVSNAYQKTKILENTNIYENVFKMVVELSSDAKAGQFCMLRSWDLNPLLSRPISICDADEKTVTFLYIVVGKGTKILSELKVDEFIYVLGPLGNGFDLKSAFEDPQNGYSQESTSQSSNSQESYFQEGESQSLSSQESSSQESSLQNNLSQKNTKKRAALISGGIGIAPLLLLAKKLYSNDIEVDLYSGFRDFNYFTDEFKPYVSHIKISSENGVVGTKGNVLTIFENKKYNAIYACGPNKMLQAIQSYVEDNHMDHLQLSLEAHMACGIGACLGCTVKTKDKMSRVCAEGPVFDFEEVIFNG